MAKAFLSKDNGPDLVDTVPVTFCTALRIAESVKLAPFAVFTVWEKDKRMDRNLQSYAQKPVMRQNAIGFYAGFACGTGAISITA